MDQPPPLHPAPSSDPGAAKKGCFGCLGITFLVVAILLLIPYLVIFHSPLPVKWVASELADNSNLDGSSIDLKGVGGSISKGVTVKEIVVYGAEGDSTIEGFKFHFNGLVDSIRNKRLIIEELSTERAEFVVGPNFFEETDDEEEKEEETTERDKDKESKPSDFRFELQEMRFANSRFRSTDGKLDFEIPLVRLAGLKIDEDGFELEEIEVVSDFISAELSEASSATIDGQTVPFTKMVSGKVLPRIHPLVKSEIDFSAEFSTVDGKTSHRFLSFDGAFLEAMLPDRTRRLQFKSFNPGDYFDCENLVMPQNFTMMAREENSTLILEPGEFSLGETRFMIAGQEIDTDHVDEEIPGSAEVGNYQVEARIRPGRGPTWPPFFVELTSEPELGPRKLLALVYFQRDLSELTEEEKAKVERLHQSQSAPEQIDPPE